MQVVAADAVAQAARSGVDQDRELALSQAESRGGLRIVDALDRLQLEEVVAGAESAELRPAGSTRTGRARLRRALLRWRNPSPLSLRWPTG